MNGPKPLTCAQRMIIRAVREAAYALASIALRDLRAAANHAAASGAYTGCAAAAAALAATGVYLMTSEQIAEAVEAARAFMATSYDCRTITASEMESIASALLAVDKREREVLDEFGQHVGALQEALREAQSRIGSYLDALRGVGVTEAQLALALQSLASKGIR